MPRVTVTPYEDAVGALEALAYVEAREFLREIGCPAARVYEVAKSWVKPEDTTPAPMTHAAAGAE